MKITIITAVKNNESTIRETIESVLNQKYKNLEYIIVDGGSTDDTLKIINKFKKNISRIISEKDRGYYDAVNKGIISANGDVIGILNSDDVYADLNVIGEIANVFKRGPVDVLYADLVYVDRKDNNKIIRCWKSEKFLKGSFQNGFHPPHPTFFVKKDFYNELGLYDINFKISADFELMLRFLEKNKLAAYYFPKTIVRMRSGGVSNKNILNHLIGNYYCYKAFKKNGMKVPMTYIFKRILPKVLTQYSTVKMMNYPDHKDQ